MKLRLILFWALLACAEYVLAQSQVNGKVTDQVTHEPLPFANVFFNNSTIGTTSDSVGHFVLTTFPEGPADLVVSYVGYQTWQQKIKPTVNEPLHLDVRLVPITNELAEVEVTEKRDKEWEKKFKKFEKEFLGETFNAKRCKILNPWVVDFVEGDKFMMAVAREPLEIENMGLGYKIYFYIKKFEVGPNLFSLIGNVQFVDLEPPTEGTRIRWEKNREDAYLGSERHFFKSILKNDVLEEGFSVYVERSPKIQLIRAGYFNDELKQNHLIPLTISAIGSYGAGNEFKIRIPGRVEVHYKYLNGPSFYRDIPYPVSWIDPVIPVVTVTSTGVLYNPLDVRLSGFFITRRVADMLPVDYQPE